MSLSSPTESYPEADQTIKRLSQLGFAQLTEDGEDANQWRTDPWNGRYKVFTLLDDPRAESIEVRPDGSIHFEWDQAIAYQGKEALKVMVAFAAQTELSIHVPFFVGEEKIATILVDRNTDVDQVMQDLEEKWDRGESA